MAVKWPEIVVKWPEIVLRQCCACVRVNVHGVEANENSATRLEVCFQRAPALSWYGCFCLDNICVIDPPRFKNDASHHLREGLR